MDYTRLGKVVESLMISLVKGEIEERELVHSVNEEINKLKKYHQRTNYDINARLAEINSRISGRGREFITNNDVIWLMNTVYTQQQDIERLKVVEQAYEAYKLAK